MESNVLSRRTEEYRMNREFVCAARGKRMNATKVEPQSMTTIVTLLSKKSAIGPPTRGLTINGGNIRKNSRRATGRLSISSWSSFPPRRIRVRRDNVAMKFNQLPHCVIKYDNIYKRKDRLPFKSDRYVTFEVLASKPSPTLTPPNSSGEMDDESGLSIVASIQSVRKNMFVI
mmetsp:Transcript_21530/g.44896  ORF Transcript_21530/g.44896 Transcript_21530/m.44896 type:complete len:173 (+) Transcript_21530:1005-1523(+)